MEKISIDANPPPGLSNPVITPRIPPVRRGRLGDCPCFKLNIVISGKLSVYYTVMCEEK